MVPVESWALTVTTGCPVKHLPGTRLWVTAHLDAFLCNDLALQEWEIV